MKRYCAIFTAKQGFISCRPNERETGLAGVTVMGSLPNRLSLAGGEALLYGRRCSIERRTCRNWLFPDISGDQPWDEASLIGCGG